MKKVGQLSGLIFRSRFARIWILGGLFSLVSLGVSAQLIADFSASSTAVCPGSSVTFTDNTVNITGEATYNWNFGNGATPATASGAGPHSVTYSVEGPVTVTLTVTDASGPDEEIKTDYITVSGVAPLFTSCPGSMITQDADPGLCTAIVDYASLVVTSGSPEPDLSYTFSGATTGSGSGTGSGSAFSIGTTLVEITASNSCSTTAICSFSVFINSSPVADAGGPYESCRGSAVTLDGTGSSDSDSACGDNISYYGWDIDNDGTDDLTGAVQSLPHASLVGYGIGVGVNTIRLTVKDSFGVSHSDNTTLTIHSLPVTSSITGDATPACSATGVPYSVILTEGSTYTWTVPEGATIADGHGTNSITVDYGTTNGNISVTERNAAGCYGSAVTLTVSLQGCGLDADFEGEPTEICIGSEVTFTDISTGTSGSTTYSWSFGEGASPATAITSGPHDVTYTTAGTKTVSLTITEGASNAETKIDYITVNSCLKTLTLSSVLLEGLYNGSGMMRQAQNASGAQWPVGVADHVTIELHEAANYSNIVWSATDVPLSTTGSAIISVPPAYSGTYFITIRHRNSIETTTSTAVSFTESSITQSFALRTSVFGSNLGSSGDGYYVIYGADVNQDGIVDTGDMNEVDNSSTAILIGYNLPDANGDGIVDTSDMNIVDNNSTAIIMRRLPN